MANMREVQANLYKPVGSRPISLGNAFVQGGQLNIAQGVDLSLPLRGLRFVFKGRLTIGVANMATVNIEGLLNLIQRIRVNGVNKRLGGAVTLWDIDLATLWVMQHLFQRRAGYFDINATLRAVPTTPFPAAGANGYLDGTAANYDFRIQVDLPFHPFSAPDGVKAGFLVRQEEFKDTIQIMVDYGTLVNGANQCSIGIGAAGTTYVTSGYGGVGAAPTLDVYSLPIQMGTDIKDAVLPGLLTRTQQQINAILNANGVNVALLNLQKKKTTRIFAKIGTSALAPYFTTLSDLIVTGLGVVVAGNRNVRDVVDVFATKGDTMLENESPDAIQGYNVMDFIQSGNPDSAYPADEAGDGVTFTLNANTAAGGANSFGVIVQEQMIFSPEGALYS